MVTLAKNRFSKYYAEAIRRTGDAAERKLGRLVLESRLDNLVYKAKFASTVFASRRFVNHGHVTVNGKKLISLLTWLKSAMLSKFVKKSKTAPGLLLPLLKTPTVNCRVIWKLMVKTDRKIHLYSEIGRCCLRLCYGTESGYRILFKIVVTNIYLKSSEPVQFRGFLL